MPSYEPEVIELFAAQLERRARAVRRGFCISGLVLGAIFGSFPLTSYGSAWPIPHILGFTTLIVGAGIGALIGWVVGEGRAAMYRLHAQTTLCQLHAQRTTLAIWRLLQERPSANHVEAITKALELEPEPEPEFEPEPEPILAPAARLAAPPALRATAAPVEPPRVVEPIQVRPPAPEPLPAPPPTPAYEPPPAYEPTPAFETAPAFAARATPAALRPAAPAPPVQPPPLSG